MSRSEKEKAFDFGFSLVSEDELRALERELAEKNKVVSSEAEVWKTKFDDLYDMVMILLKNLLADPKKSYIHWPDRVERVQEFMRTINNLRDN